MSFLNALQEARAKAKEEISKRASVTKQEETGINIPKAEEDKTEDNLDITVYTLGDAIIDQSFTSSVKYKKLKNGCNASRRIAKAIASKNITSRQLNKAFKIQQRYNPKRADWHIVGSYALHSLKALLDDGIELNKALNTPWKDKI